MLCMFLTPVEVKTKELFHWLLARADRQDLEAVKGDRRFSVGNPNLKKL